LTGPAECPYVGLSPFTQEHAKYFFGREVDSTVIADNVLARPITVLYGASGVGKSSVLNVGLPAVLANGGIAASIVVRRHWDDSSHLVSWLDDAVRAPKETPQQPIVVVLDQFEEYFLYRSVRAGDAFERALAALLARPELETHLLFSLREDGLHLLDALRLRLPGVFDNTIELKHLDEAAVRAAIAGPIDVYNKQEDDPNRKVQIDSEFVDRLLIGLRSSLLAIAHRRSATPERVAIELPFVQLALQRIWERMREVELWHLTSELLDTMGDVAGIVDAHVRDSLAELSVGEQQLASQLFHFLVTPSGGKFAHLPEDLAWLANETTPRTIDVSDVARVLQKLAAGTARLLRQSGERFELFHDVLARPILNWRATYIEREPFALLTEPLTGRIFRLQRPGCMFGRFTDLATRTPVSYQPVSRNHFLILSDGQILDLRSRFGTTVNARPLHFGDTDIFLRSGDVIGLANTATLTFNRIEDVAPQGPEAVAGPMGDGWGLLIDGGARRIIRLADTMSYLGLDGDTALTLTREPFPAAFAVLRRNDNGKVRITALSEQPSLEVIEREDSYRDRFRVLAQHEEFLIELRTSSDRRRGTLSEVEGAERGLFRIGGEYFEIILD
jgi:hypothetical protein